MHRNLRLIFETAPALSAFAALAAGAFAAAYGGCPWLLTCALLLMPAVGIAGGASYTVFGVFLPCMLFCGYFQAAAALRPPAMAQWLPREAHGVTAYLRIEQAPLSSPALSAFDSGGGGWYAALDALSPNYLPQKRLAGEAVPVVLRPRGQKVREKLAQYGAGTPLVATGSLLRLLRPEESVAADWYAASLRSRGVKYALTVDEVHERGEDSSAFAYCITRKINAARIALGERLVRGIDCAEDAQLLLALGLGMSDFTAPETRARQAAAGTVHIFAISGMHVGLMALAIAGLMRLLLLPQYCQLLGTGALCTVYVLLTGAAPSSRRALLMTLVVIYTRFRRRPPSWLNALGVAGVIAIFQSPPVVLNIGFIFSYMAVFLLLMRAPVAAHTAAVLDEKRCWLPRGRPFSGSAGILAKFAAGMQLSLEAWLGSAGLALCLTSRFSLLAPLVNFAVSPVAWLTLMLCPLRIALGLFLPESMDLMMASLLGCMARVTRFLSECGAESAFCLAVRPPPLWRTVCCHILLMFWLLNAGGGGGGEKTSGG